jgi:hypothetical protein
MTRTRLPWGPEKDPDAGEPGVRAEARAFAEHIVVVARSEALSMLGEKDAGIRAVTDWMKGHREE